MLYPTLNQPLVIIMMLIAGFASGIVFDVCRILTTLSGNDRLSKHLFDFIATILSFAILFLNNLHFNYGQFRVYVVAIFLLSFWIERKLVQKLWTKLLQKWYSNIVQRREDWKKKRNRS